MAHVRSQIRQAAAAALAGLATSGARVFVNRLYELRAVDLPCLLVQTGDEPQIDPFDLSGGVVQRQMVLTVRAIAKASTGLDDTLDQMLLEVETALAASTLGGLIKRLELKAVNLTESAALDAPAGELAATWLATYLTSASNPNTPL